MYMTWLNSNICMTWLISYVYDMPHSKHIWHASFQMCMTRLITVGFLVDDNVIPHMYHTCVWHASFQMYDMPHFKCIRQDSLPSAFLSMIISRTVLPNMFFFCKKKMHDMTRHERRIRLGVTWPITNVRRDSSQLYMSCLTTRTWWWNIWHDSLQMYDMTHTNVWPKITSCWWCCAPSCRARLWQKNGQKKWNKKRCCTSTHCW